MKKPLCLILAMILCLPGILQAARAEDGESDPWAAAFDGTARLRLVSDAKTSAMPAVEGKTLTLLDLSPDGKTQLCLIEETIVIEPDPAESQESPEDGSTIRVKTRRSTFPGMKRRSSPRTETTYGLGLVRDGVLTPVVFNPDRGGGDPYDTWPRITQRLPRLPGREGFSWSADGRYVTFSDVEITRDTYNQGSLNVPVVDTAEAEMWFADSYQDSNLFLEGYGTVQLCRMSRDGRYVFWLVLQPGDSATLLRFCRCPVEGSGREVLCEIPLYDDILGLAPLSSSNLFERADGSWVLSYTDGWRKGNRSTNVLIRFAPSGEAWAAEVQTTGIMMPLESTRFDLSAASGYGLMVIINQNSTQTIDMAVSEGASVSSIAYSRFILNHLNLLRILPGEDPACDIWYFQQAGENPADAALVPGEEYLRDVHALTAGEDVRPPEDFDPDSYWRHPMSMIFNACLSPDGRYALLTVSVDRTWCFYLARPETMEIRLVYARKGLAHDALAIGTPYARRSYRPGMVWNPDGTLLIMNEFGYVEAFRLETW